MVRKISAGSEPKNHVHPLQRSELTISGSGRRWANAWRKFIDPLRKFPQHLAEMFAKLVKPMTAAAALKRVAWHFIVSRRVF
jgi:hypothetical protein